MFFILYLVTYRFSIFKFSKSQELQIESFILRHGNKTESEKTDVVF